MIAGIGPGVEFVGAVSRLDIGIELIGSAERASLAASQVKGLTTAVGFAFAVADADDRGVSVGTGLDAIMPRLESRKRLIGGIDLEVIAVAQPAHRNVDRAGGELDLNCIVIEVQERETGIGSQSNHGGPQWYFCARILIGPELIPTAHRTVGNRSRPIRFAGRLK